MPAEVPPLDFSPVNPLTNAQKRALRLFAETDYVTTRRIHGNTARALKRRGLLRFMYGAYELTDLGRLVAKGLEDVDS